MFERYTEKARRVIFFARYEAAQFGTPTIESEHLLLGLLREDKGLTNQFFSAANGAEKIRNQIESATVIREKISTSVDLPLSNDSKRILAYAAEEAMRLDHKHIGTEHLFLGMIREEGSFAGKLLKERGIKLDQIRKAITDGGIERSPSAAGTGMGAGTTVRDAAMQELQKRLATGGIGLVELGPGEFLMTNHSNSVIPRVGDSIAIHARDASGGQPPGIAQQHFRVTDVVWNFEKAMGASHLRSVILKVEALGNSSEGSSD